MPIRLTGGRKSVRLGDSLAVCVALAVSDGERLEDQGSSGAETWRRVKYDLAGYRDLWLPKHEGPESRAHAIPDRAIAAQDQTH